MTRFIGGVRDRAAAWRSIATYLGHWALRGYGLWVVESRDDATMLGRVGLWYPEGWPGIEVGWTLGRAAWGQGYATEAARAAMAWAHEPLGLDHVISVVDPRNARSIEVARRLGMRHERDVKLAGITSRMYATDLPARPSQPQGRHRRGSRPADQPALGLLGAPVFAPDGHAGDVLGWRRSH